MKADEYDYLNIKLLQPSGDTVWYTKLSADGQSIVATASAGDRLATVYLAPINGADTADGKTANTAIKTFSRAKQLLANNGKIILVPPATIEGNELWELPNNVFGDNTVVTDTDTDTTIITVTGTLDIGKETNLTDIDKIYNAGTVNSNENATAKDKTDTTTTPPALTETPSTEASIITVKVNDVATEHGSDTLQAAVEAAVGSSALGTVTKLTVMAGEVTTADWVWFSGNGTPVLTALESFTVEAAVAKVADIPGESSKKTFPTSFKTVTIPQVKSIGKYAFMVCKNLTNVSFPAATSIGDSAFIYCGNLTSTSFPEAITIGTNAFENCTSLAEISLPQVTEIGERAFVKCTSLTSASVPKVTT